MKSTFTYIAFVVAGNAKGMVTSAIVSTQPRFRMEINRSIGVLEVFENQEPADAVYNFARLHGLDISQRDDILDNICQSLSCTRKQALLWSIPVDLGNEAQELFQVYEGVEPADAVHEFVGKHKLGEEFSAAIMKKACAAVECKRSEPVIYTKIVKVDGTEFRIEFLEGQEPADVIYAALKPLGVSFEDRHKLFQEVKDQIPFTREHAVIFSQGVLLENERSFSEQFVMYDDGKEPVDELYDFAKTHSIESYFEGIAKALMPKLCEVTSCTRYRPYIWRKQVNNKDGQQLGVLVILSGDEPIDAIDQFVQSIGIEASDRIINRDHLYNMVCDSIKCNRSKPVVYRKSVNDESGQKIGDLEIFEGEEVTDRVDTFLGTLNANFDKTAFRRLILADACSNERVKCTTSYE